MTDSGELAALGSLGLEVVTLLVERAAPAVHRALIRGLVAQAGREVVHEMIDYEADALATADARADQAFGPRDITPVPRKPK